MRFNPKSIILAALVAVAAVLAVLPQASAVSMKSGSPFLYDDNDRIVGVKDPDGAEYYFARYPSAAAASATNPASTAITGGTINGATIGATTPSTARFTTATLSGDLIVKTMAVTGQISTPANSSTWVDYHTTDGYGRIGSPGAAGDYAKPLQIINPLKIASQTPASASATCTQWTVTADASYLYVCVATDTWKRAAIATW